jgi:hypothetical protein
MPPPADRHGHPDTCTGTGFCRCQQGLRDHPRGAHRRDQPPHGDGFWRGDAGRIVPAWAAGCTIRRRRVPHGCVATKSASARTRCAAAPVSCAAMASTAASGPAPAGQASAIGRGPPWWARGLLVPFSIQGDGVPPGGGPRRAATRGWLLNRPFRADRPSPRREGVRVQLPRASRQWIGAESGWEAEALRRLEADLFADPAQARRLRWYTAGLACNTSDPPPPTWWQLVSCALLLMVDAAVLSIAVNLNSAPLLALVLFVGTAVPFFIKPPWQRRPRLARGRKRRRWPSPRRGPRPPPRPAPR